MLIGYLWFYRLQEILLILRFPRKYTVRFLLSEDYNKNLCIFPIFSFYISVFFSLYFRIFLSIFTLCIFPSFFSLSIFVTYRSLFSLYIFPSYIQHCSDKSSVVISVTTSHQMHYWFHLIFLLLSYNETVDQFHLQIEFVGFNTTPDN